MKRLMSLALVASCALALSACTMTAEECEKSKLAVQLGRQALDEACTKQSPECDAAGLALKVANMALALNCPAGTSP